MDKDLRVTTRNSVLLTISWVMVSGICKASEFQYFDDSINYWGKDAKVQNAAIPKENDDMLKQEKAREDGTTNAIAKEKEQFQWNRYLDPSNKEFFREGDYTPPEPFMELVRRPTDQNIRMWFAYMERKNELASRLSKRMEEYAQTNGAAIPKEAKEKIVNVAKQIPTAVDDYTRYRFRMYFDSQCPHCERMFETLNDLQDRGYFVEARQVDNGSLDRIKSHVPVVAAKPEEIKQYNITAVPLLLIGDLKSKKVYRQSGYMTPEQILAEIKER
ncbi:MAG: TlpA family protein disulfide reductase [Oligoflexales bacterium]